MGERANVYLERLRACRSAVSESPFYTSEQREAVLFTLDLIEFGEVQPALSPPADEKEKG